MNRSRGTVAARRPPQRSCERHLYWIADVRRSTRVQYCARLGERVIEAPFVPPGTSSLLGIGLGAFLAITVASDALAQDLTSDPLVESVPGTSIQFSTATQSLAANQIQIFNGRSPDKGDWTSIAITSSKTGTAGARTCTASFVGRNVVVTAAHCVIEGVATAPSALSIGSLRFECTIDRAYADASPSASGVRHYADYALCLADPKASRPVAFEQLRWEALDLEAVSASTRLLAAGYGCVSWSFEPATGRLVQGPPRLQLAVGDIVVDRIEAEHFVSISDGKTASALCAGDSGGPVFSGVSVGSLGTPRVIRGIASQNPANVKEVRSYFTSLSTPRFRRFLECWMGRHPGAQVRIRGSAPAPAPRTCP